MATLFVLSVAVQVNDPEPIHWIALYTSAAVLAGASAARLRVPPASAAVVGVVAAGWGLRVALSGPLTSASSPTMR